MSRLVSSPLMTSKGPFDHHPMFRAMMMALQRQFSAGFHHDALDLITIPSVETLIPSPRSIHARVL